MTKHARKRTHALRSRLRGRSLIEHVSASKMRQGVPKRRDLPLRGKRPNVRRRKNANVRKKRGERDRRKWRERNAYAWKSNASANSVSGRRDLNLPLEVRALQDWRRADRPASMSLPLVEEMEAVAVMAGLVGVTLDLLEEVDMVEVAMKAAGMMEVGTAVVVAAAAGLKVVTVATMGLNLQTVDGVN